MDKEHILALDQGTTGTTVLVFDRAGRVKGRAAAEFTQHFPRPGWVEHDAEEIWASVCQLVPEALEDAGLGVADLAAIGITNQRETVVCWERASGVPVARAIVWQDRRTAEMCATLEAEGVSEMLQARTGLLLDPYFSGTKVKWLLEHVDGLRRRACAGEVVFGTVDSWLAWKLTGGNAFVTDPSNASRTLLFDIHRVDWDDDILHVLDVPREALASIVPTSGVCAEATNGPFEGHEIPLGALVGDQQASLFGQACFEEGRAKNTYGTGSFLMTSTGMVAVTSRHRLLTTIAWQLGNEPVEYALEGSSFISGAAVQWLRDGLGLIKEAAETEQLAASIQTNEGVYFVPALAGLGAPHWDPQARGAFLGLTRGTTRAHVCRAVLESIAYQTRDVLLAMERDAGMAIEELRVDGGATRNAFLMQFQADVLGVPVTVAEVTETTALGAASLAGLATGLWKSRAEIDARWRPARHFAPVLAQAERELLYARWLEAIERSRGWAHGG